MQILLSLIQRLLIIDKYYCNAWKAVWNIRVVVKS